MLQISRSNARVILNNWKNSEEVSKCTLSSMRLLISMAGIMRRRPESKLRRSWMKGDHTGIMGIKHFHQRKAF